MRSEKNNPEGKQSKLETERERERVREITGADERKEDVNTETFPQPLVSLTKIP